SDSFNRAVVSPGAKLAATTHNFPFKIKLWDLATDKELKSFEGYVTSLTFSPDSQLLAWMDSEGRGEVWNIEKDKKEFSFEGIKSGEDGLAFSPDGRFLAAAGGFEPDPVHVKIFEVSSGKELTAFNAHRQGVFHVAFSRDSCLLATGGGDDHLVKLWDIS